MQRRNSDIKETIKKAGLMQWQVAEKMNMSDSNFSRILRYELTNAKKRQIFAAIDELKKDITYE